jgi:hypothetical protein
MPDMERYVIAARLKPGKEDAAERTLSAGPPFDPAEAGLSTHAAYLTEDNVYFLFEGEGARTRAIQLARDHVVEVSQWQGIVGGFPSRVSEIPPNARCLYRWTSQASDSPSP